MLGARRPALVTLLPPASSLGLPRCPDKRIEASEICRGKMSLFLTRRKSILYEDWWWWEQLVPVLVSRIIPLGKKGSGLGMLLCCRLTNGLVHVAF